MTDTEKTQAIEAANATNALHASHGAMEVMGIADGQAQVRCQCGVDMVVTVNQVKAPTEASEAPTPVPVARDGSRRIFVRDKDGE